MPRQDRASRPADGTVSRRLAWVLVGCGVALVPWTVYLVLTLPRVYTGHHYKASWTLFDIALLVALITTGIEALRGGRGTSLAAAATGTLLFVDAWFDVSGSGNRLDFRTALLTAVLVEIPLGVLCWRVARRTARPWAPMGARPDNDSPADASH